MGNLLIAYWNFHWEGGDSVRTVNNIVVGTLASQIGQRASHMNFDSFRHALAYFDIVLTSHVFLYFVVEIVAGYFDGIVRNYAAERNHCYLGCTAAYIHNHVSLGGFNVQTVFGVHSRFELFLSYAYGCSHGFENKVNVASAGMFGTVANGTQFHFGGTRRNADNHS